MAKYKFEQFGTLEIEPTKIEVVRVLDDVIEKVADVEIALFVGIIEYKTILNGFTYVNTWEDSDVEAWVNLELQNYITN